MFIFHHSDFKTNNITIKLEQLTIFSSLKLSRYLFILSCFEIFPPLTVLSYQIFYKDQVNLKDLFKKAKITFECLVLLFCLR